MADDPGTPGGMEDPGPGLRGSSVGAVVADETRELMEVSPKTRSGSGPPS